MRLGEAAQRMQVEAIPTGSIALDLALGIGGIPRGRVIEVFGAESAGKSTLCNHIVAEAQRPWRNRRLHRRRARDGSLIRGEVRRAGGFAPDLAA